MMLVRDATCAHCGRTWTTNQSPDIEWCKPECADAWMDAHPDEKARRNWRTRQDVVDSMLARNGLMPMPRATPAQGDN